MLQSPLEIRMSSWTYTTYDIKMFQVHIAKSIYKKRQ